MKTYVTAIQKGGEGKTMVTCSLAFASAERGQRTAVVDLDTQGNASSTLSEHQVGLVASELFSGNVDALRARLEQHRDSALVVIAADAGLANLDKADLGQAAMALKASLAVLGEFFDVCLIDTPPSLGVAMTTALLVGDFLLSPVAMEKYSLDGMQKMVAVIGNLRPHNPKLKFLGMVPNKVNGNKPRHINNLRALREAYPSLVLPFSIGDRDSIAESLGEGRPVWTSKKTAARIAIREVRALTEYVFENTEIA